MSLIGSIRDRSAWSASSGWATWTAPRPGGGGAGSALSAGEGRW